MLHTTRIDVILDSFKKESKKVVGRSRVTCCDLPSFILLAAQEKAYYSTNTTRGGCGGSYLQKTFDTCMDEE